ncbi:hypothetical protein TNCV_3683091 [Trichonephila clavipes]|nr:hypothetical protein TNCV_3683091 [Trichonephila clavipes]
MIITLPVNFTVFAFLEVGEDGCFRSLLCCFMKRSVMSHRKQRSAFDQVSEFDRGKIVAYRDCGLSIREIGRRVG